MTSNISLILKSYPFSIMYIVTPEGGRVMESTQNKALSKR